jgi:hypothetical protein
VAAGATNTLTLHLKVRALGDHVQPSGSRHDAISRALAEEALLLAPPADDIDSPVSTVV